MDTRTQRIEDELRGLVAWLQAFAGEVRDHNGVSIKGDLDELLASAEAVLRANGGITPEQVRRLQDETGAAYVDCVAAILKVGLGEAANWLRSKSSA